jgi:protein-S-isoprenylcysteine O-methyltransferase Ste14
VALVLLAAAFDLSGLLAFRRARTTINPMKPGASSAMVSGGVYRITRNPMYVGLVLLLCGWSVYLGSPWAWLAPLAFAAYVTRFQIVPEERVLARLFGAEYAAYRARVRRWL